MGKNILLTGGCAPSRWSWHGCFTLRGIACSWLKVSGAVSIPVSLYETVHQGLIHQGNEILLIGTGAGLSIGGLILTY